MGFEAPLTGSNKLGPFESNSQLGPSSKCQCRPLRSLVLLNDAYLTVSQSCPEVCH